MWRLQIFGVIWWGTFSNHHDTEVKSSLSKWICVLSKVYRVYLPSLNSVKWSPIFAEVELWMTVSKLKTVGFVQSLEFLKKSWNLPSHFPDLGKVWKIEVKSWKNGKKSWVFLKAVQQILQKWIFFFVLVKSYSISPACHGKSFVHAFFLSSLLITYFITLSLEK